MIAIFASGLGADVTAPVLSSPAFGSLTDTSGVPSVSTNEGNGTLYYAILTNGGSATNAQIKAGSGGNIVSGKAGNQAVSTTGTQTFSATTGLTAGTTYQVVFLQTDAAGNDSLQSQVSFMTVALFITDHTYVCDQCGDAGPGSVVMSGFTAWDGYLDLTGYTYTSFSAPTVTTTSNRICFTSTQVATVDMRALTANGWLIEFIGCPLTSVNFDALQTIDGNHIYLSGAVGTGSAGLSGGVSFPALTTINKALVLSRRYQLSSFSAPLLATINHELELDYTKALTALSLPSLTAINNNSGNGQLFGGGDMTDIGQTNPCALASLSLPVLATITGRLSFTSCPSLTTVDPSSWTTIGNGFTVDFDRDALTQAAMDAILVKLAAILGGVTSGTVDVRFQTGGALPSATGQAAAATLVAAGIRNNQGGTDLYGN